MSEDFVPANPSTKVKKDEALKGGRETSVQSSSFRLRRVRDLIVIESLVSRLTQGDAIIDVTRQAVEKNSDGVIFHLPTPTYVTSDFMRCLRDAAEIAQENSVPYFAVVHVKLRLLIEMFGLEHVIRPAKTLVEAMESLKPDAFKHPASDDD